MSPETAPGSAALALVGNLPAEASLGLALLDGQARVLTGSPSLLGLFGAETLTGRPLAELAGPEVGAVADRVLAGGRGEDLELDVKPSARWLVLARPLDAGDVRLGLAIGDITERGAVEAELRESERQLEAAQRIARMGWWRAELDPPRLLYSPALASIAGLVGEEADGAIDVPDWRERVVPADRARVEAEAAAAVRDRRDLQLQVRVRRPDGLPLRLEVRASPVVGPDGDVVALAGLTQDVTAIARAGRLQGAIAELGRAGLSAEGHDDLIEHTCRLVADALDVEWAFVEPPGAAPAPPAAATADMRCTIRGPDRLHGTLVAATAAPRRFAADEVAFLEGAAHVLGEAIARRDAADAIAELSASRGRLVAQALDAEAQARRGISERLHDGPLQDLLAAGHDLYGLGDGPDAIAAQGRFRAIAREVRQVMVGLHPTVLRYGGLEAALEAVAEQVADAAGLTAEVRVRADATGVHEELLLSTGRQLAADAARHEGVSRLALTVRRAAGCVELEVADDGTFEPARVALGTVAERAAAVGGRLEARSAPRGGTVVVVSLPVP